MSEAMPYRILIDTNVLINDFLYRKHNVKTGESAYRAMEFLRKRSRNVQTHIASIALLQLHSTLSKAKISQEEIAEEVRTLVAKHVVINFTEADINNALSLAGNDLEDAMQYQMAKKMRCSQIVTANKKDFKTFPIQVFAPSEIRVYL